MNRIRGQSNPVLQFVAGLMAGPRQRSAVGTLRFPSRSGAGHEVVPPTFTVECQLNLPTAAEHQWNL